MLSDISLDPHWDRLNRTEKSAWVAGFLDGEGYFSISTRRPDSTPSSPIVSASQLDRRPLARVNEIFPGSWGHSRTRHWVWRIHGEPAVQVCREILPFLSSPKRLQARALIAYWENCRIGSSTCRPKLMAWVKSLRHWYKQALSDMKRHKMVMQEATPLAGRDAQGVIPSV